MCTDVASCRVQRTNQTFENVESIKLFGFKHSLFKKAKRKFYDFDSKLLCNEKENGKSDEQKARLK